MNSTRSLILLTLLLGARCMLLHAQAAPTNRTFFFCVVSHIDDSGHETEIFTKVLSIGYGGDGDLLKIQDSVHLPLRSYLREHQKDIWPDPWDTRILPICYIGAWDRAGFSKRVGGAGLQSLGLGEIPDTYYGLEKARNFSMESWQTPPYHATVEETPWNCSDVPNCSE